MDPNNPECNTCGSDLGASTCLPAYRWCLLSECWANSHCTACKFKCELLYEGGPDPTDPNSPECKECGSNLGASDCPASDDQCLVDQCLSYETCFYCKFDCNGLRGQRAVGAPSIFCLLSPFNFLCTISFITATSSSSRELWGLPSISCVLSPSIFCVL
jgi:hypothetical protein